jgi:hypothetical protein
LAVVLSGNSFIYKTNEKSDKLISFFFEVLGNSIKEMKQTINFTDDRIKIADKYIFTHLKDEKPELKKYFAENKTLFEIRYQSVAVLNGNENPEELNLLGEDIFSFFGRGSGNVRKIYIPSGYDLTIFIRAIEEWHFLRDHNAYANNYQYYSTIYLLNNIQYLDNGFLLLKEDDAFIAPIGVLYYEYYENKDALLERLSLSSGISAIYTSCPIHENINKFGESVNQMLVPDDNIKKFLL